MLARIEIFHSRAIAPTRRVALGDFHLPIAPPPGLGAILLGGIVAANIAGLDDEMLDELPRLMLDIENGGRIRQPRLRNRLQVDRVGLRRSTFALHGGDATLAFDFEQTCTPAQAVLGALYATGRIDDEHRHGVMATIRRSTRWGGPVGPDLIARLGGGTSGPFALGSFDDPVGWALDMLGFTPAERIAAEPGRATPSQAQAPQAQAPQAQAPVGWTAPPRDEVLALFRQRLSEAHPDHGGESDGAAQRIADLTEARRILLGR